MGVLIKRITSRWEDWLGSNPSTATTENKFMLELLLMVAILGAALYLIEKYVPMAEPIATLFRILVVIIVVSYLLQIIGVHLPYKLPRLNLSN